MLGFPFNLAGSGNLFDRVKAIADVFVSHDDGDISKSEIVDLTKDKEPEAGKYLDKGMIESVTKAGQHFDVVRSTTQKTEYPVSNKKDNDTYLVLDGSDPPGSPAMKFDLTVSDMKMLFGKIGGVHGKHQDMEADADWVELKKIPNATHVTVMLNTFIGPYKVETDVKDKALASSDVRVTIYPNPGYMVFVEAKDGGTTEVTVLESYSESDANEYTFVYPAGVSVEVVEV